MDGNVAVGFEPAVGEATAPDYIVTAVKWKMRFMRTRHPDLSTGEGNLT